MAASDRSNIGALSQTALAPDWNVLEQRWSLLRQAAAAEGLDVLVVVGRGMISQYGGFHYVSGLPLHLIHAYAVVPQAGDPILIMPGRSRLFARTLGLGRLIRKDVATPDGVLAAGRESSLAVELAELLGGLSAKVVGIAGLQNIMPIDDFEELKRRQPEMSFQDASRILQRVKAKKLPRELAAIRRAYCMVDDGLEAALQRIAPGVREIDVVAAIDETLRRRGAIGVIVQVNNGELFTRYPTDRVIGSGEVVSCIVEAVAPDGYWSEKGAMIAVGPTSPRTLELYDSLERVYATAEDLLRPGVTADELTRKVGEAITAEGYAPGMWSGHGVGVDHDLPIFNGTDSTPMEANMVISLHPHLHNPETVEGAFMIDQYIIGDQLERLSRFPRRFYYAEDYK